MTRLTTRRLRAICEGLCNSLAGALDNDLEREDYEAALAWAQEQLERREKGDSRDGISKD